MRDLNQSEIQAISAASINPSEWVWGGVVGALVGTATFTICSFSTNALVSMSNPVKCIALGTALGAGFMALYDILHEIEK